ncbi:MAG TPA: RNA-binding cell elongation regulator Jag/EloR [Vicinamibacterales bacterium]|nr:RNA-binding cell elongation regulator Jag/EloR [Vicinamibacterales bacterium]
MTELTAEATGETVGEAKWNALRDLERRVPLLDKSSVRFQVLAEGERGLLGVGFTPARVLAAVSAEHSDIEEPLAPDVDESELARRVRGVLTHVTTAMGLHCRITIVEDESSLTATCTGGDLGLLIGKHGQTIDAVQTLAGAIAGGASEERKEIVVDASDYRSRRRATIESLALSAATEVLRSGARVALEPMSAAERKLAHERLADEDGVTTVSEGAEPNRYLVVEPA